MHGIIHCKLLLQIDFLLASDGKPWVWVMGEHEADIPYDEIVSGQISYLRSKHLMLLLFQVQQRELKKQEDEKLAEIKEAEKLTKTGIISILSKTTSIRLSPPPYTKAFFTDEMEGVSVRDRPRGSATERC